MEKKAIRTAERTTMLQDAELRGLLAKSPEGKELLRLFPAITVDEASSMLLNKVVDSNWKIHGRRMKRYLKQYALPIEEVNKQKSILNFMEKLRLREDITEEEYNEGIANLKTMTDAEIEELYDEITGDENDRT